LKNPLNIFNNRSVFFWIGLLLLLGFILVTAAVDFQPASIAQWFETAASSPLAIPATILIYMLAAFVSAPQWMLHGGAVLAFGPVAGSAIAWTATMVSASFDFWLGRRLGAERVGRFGGQLVGRLIEVVKKHGFWTSLAVRVVPTGPFIMVNMAAGIARMKFVAFFIGTAIGILPKIITIAFFGEGISGAATGKGPLYVAIVVGIALAWLGVIFLAGSRLKRKTGATQTPKPDGPEKNG